MPDKDVFIIGGGPSLTGFDFESLSDLDTIAVNVAALDVPDPTYCITADSGIFRKLQVGDFKKVKTTWVLVTNPNHCSMKMRDGRFVQEGSGYVHNLFAANMIIRNAGVEGIGFSFEDFRTGYNSGFCAFQLAVLLGYENIYLLGFDLRSGGTSHYHKRYNGRSIQSADLEKFYRNWVKAIPMVKERTNINVFSCSKTSRLNRIKGIRYKSMSKVLEEKNILSNQRRQELIMANDDMLSTMTCPSPEFSILICSLYERAKSLRTLLRTLKKQWHSGVEVLADVDDKEVSIGAKRNRLLNKAKGKYVAFIDDDDLVDESYIKLILEAVKTNPDCCSLIGEVSWRSRRITRKFTHSIKYNNWFKDNNEYYRCPNHLNAVKRELALKVGFPDVSMAEDQDFSLRLRPLLKTEAEITKLIYFYLSG